MKALILMIVVAIGITVAVYGFVALIVQGRRFGPASGAARRRDGGAGARHRALHAALHEGADGGGTVPAMIWVGGQIVIHGFTNWA